MALSITVTARKLLNYREKLTSGKFNLANLITLLLSGQASTAQIEDGAVTSAKSTPGAWFWGTDSGTATAHVVALGGAALTAYVTGHVVAYKVNTTSTGAAVTVNVSNLGAKSIKLTTGQDPKAGDLRAGTIVELRYDGTNYQLLTVGANDNDRAVTDTGSANAYVVTHGGTTGWPTVAALKTGVRVTVKASFGCTGACTLNVDGLGAKAIRKNGDAALVEGDIVTNQFFTAVYDEAANAAAGAWLLLSPTVAPPAAVLIGQSVNLLIIPNAGAPTTKIDITADAVTLKTASGLALLAENVSVTVDLAAAGNGANKLDTGSKAAGTWYYVWLISDGTTTAGLFSASSTAPTLPTNYVYKALLGVVRNSGATAQGATSDTIVPFRQQGRRVWIRDINLITNVNPTHATNWNLISAASVTVAPNTLLPPTAKRVFGTCGSNTTACAVNLAADGNGLGAVTIATYAGVDSNSFFAAAPFELPLATAQDFYWRGYAAVVRINLSGYEL